VRRIFGDLGSRWSGVRVRRERLMGVIEKGRIGIGLKKGVGE
jgi:hypothetical protein